MTDCAHALLRRVTPGGRCPVCRPREDPQLRAIERAITPVREVIADTRDLLADDPYDEELLFRLEALRAQIALEEQALAVEDAAAALGDVRLFAELAWPSTNPEGRPYRPNIAVDAMLLHLQALEDGEFNLLGIAACPGIAKSTVVSVIYPAWIWARDPRRSLICASHAYALATEIASRFLRLVESDWYRAAYPKSAQLASQAINKIETEAGGKRHAVGLESSLTGLRATAGIVDDSVNAIHGNNPKVIRDATGWYDKAFSTRFDPRVIPDGAGGVRSAEASQVIAQQRFAQDDLIDRVRELGGEVLSLPARFNPARRSVTSLWRDPRTEPGELLAPDVHSESYLAERERALGQRGMAAQYDQEPKPEGGDRFKTANWAWCQLADAPPRVRPSGSSGAPARLIARREDGSLEVDWATLSVDATNGATGPDASALGMGLVVGTGLRRSLLRDFTDGPATWAQTLVRLREAIETSLALVGKQRRVTVLLEKKAMGASEGAPLPTQIRDMLASGEFRWPDGSRAIVRLVLYEPTGKGGKPERAAAMEPDHEAGLLELLDGAPWVPDFVDEFGAFGSGSTRDDRIDYMSQVIDHHRDPKKSRGGYNKLKV